MERLQKGTKAREAREARKMYSRSILICSPSVVTLSRLLGLQDKNTRENKNAARACRRNGLRALRAAREERLTRRSDDFPGLTTPK